MWFNDLPTDQSSVIDYVDEWTRQYARWHQIELTANEKDTDKIFLEFHNNIYKNLDTLDSKASAFIAGSSIMVALYGGLIQSITNKDPKIIISWILIAGSLSSITSFILVLKVIDVFWTQRIDLEDRRLRTAVIKFMILRNRRTKYYRIAWFFMYVSIFCLCLYIISLSSNFGLSLAAIAPGVK